MTTYVTFPLGYPIGISNLICSKWNSSNPPPFLIATRWMVFAQTKNLRDMLDLFLFSNPSHPSYQ